MSFLVKLGLILSLLASLASCFTKFLRPPEWDPDQEVDRDMTKNYQYDDGESIPILFNTNIKKVDVYILQVQGDENSEWGFFNGRHNSSLVFIVLLIEPPSRWRIGYY
jgi:hypothetical protein